ncbi:Ctr copper transporter [Mycena sp. CBHHK59/15]|nr:Ctr copper transporter [Mycena sp. CBHHK59/15]
MDSMGMNMTDSSNTTTTDSSDSMSSMMMMKSYLHFTPGDTLIFDTIVASSPGAIVGTCIILFLISVGDRYLRAVCRGIEQRFTQRTKKLTAAFYFADASGKSTSSKVPASESVMSDQPVASSQKFILSHELSRGALAGLVSTVHYFLMLVVMTFNASFIISVILGVVVGEVAFGRLNH